MGIRINFENGLVSDRPNKYVIVVREDAEIVYRSGLVYLPDEERINPLDLPQGAEIYSVNHEDPQPPRGDSPGTKFTWCPYCHTWEIWDDEGDDLFSCPICGISSVEFWVRTHNHRWSKKKKGA